MASGGQNGPKLTVPYYPGEDDAGPYLIHSLEEKLTADYLRVPVPAVEDLDVFKYWAYLRDAVIFAYSQTKAGREYLDNCNRLEQTRPDRQGLRRKYGEGEPHGA